MLHLEISSNRTVPTTNFRYTLLSHNMEENTFNQNYGTIEVFLNPLSKVWQRNFPITVCDGNFNLSINKSTCDLCQIFLLDKRCSMQFCKVYQIKSNVHLLYSFIHVFFHNSSFAKPLAKAFRKTSNIWFQCY